MPEKALIKWTPVGGEFSALDVTEITTQEKTKDGKITFVIGGVDWAKGTKGYLFYARHHNFKPYRPTLRVYRKADKGSE